VNSYSEIDVTFLLSSAGYAGKDLDEIQPHFSSELDAVVGLKWYPTAMGPETWTLLISAGVPIAFFLKKFGDLLAADLYKWSKESLRKFFNSRPNNSGFLTFKFGDVTVLCWAPLEAIESTELIALLGTVDPQKAKSWHLEFNQATGKFRIEPDVSQI
jgi:hypothetical protein